MPAYLIANLIVISEITGLLRAEEWPHKQLTGAWVVTYASSDGEEVEQAKGNILVFHDNRMIFAFDRNYGPPKAELGAIGFKLHAIKTTKPSSYGLTRVQRGDLKFMLEHDEQDGNESIAVHIEDCPQNRVLEIVQHKAQRMDISQAVRRIYWLLGSPKYEDGSDARTDAVDTLEDWLIANASGETKRYLSRRSDPILPNSRTRQRGYCRRSSAMRTVPHGNMKPKLTTALFCFFLIVNGWSLATKAPLSSRPVQLAIKHKKPAYSK